MIKCPRCNKRFDSVYDLMNHRGIGEIPGPSCSVPTSSESYLIVKIGTHGSQAVKTKSVVEVGKVIRITTWTTSEP